MSLTPPPVERREDVKSRDRLDALHKAYTDSVLFIKWILVVLVAAQVVLGVFVVELLNDNSSRITDIQNSRLASCQDTNRRHNATIAALRALRDEQKRSEPDALVQLLTAAGVKVTRPQALRAFELAQVTASYASTVGIIDALAPLRNCTATVTGQNTTPGGAPAKRRS